LKYRVSAWISWGLASCLLLAVFSGVVISYPFREEIPLLSTVGLETVIPLGAFFRAFHYYTGQLSFLLLLWHLLEALLSRGDLKRPLWAWSMLVLILPLLTLSLFTGYIVRGDQTGLAAGQIAEHLALKVPFLGVVINRLLFAVSEDGIHRAFMAHLYLSSGILVISGLWHFRLKALRGEDLLWWTLLAGVLALLRPVSLEAPNLSPLLKGPWFFLGIQELLRHWPPVMAGLIFPLIPILGLLLYRFASKTCSLLLLAWTISYAILTFWGAMR
jgi:ubiquinol-cytochrome c reductase cytochrome b subunit